MTDLCRIEQRLASIEALLIDLVGANDAPVVPPVRYEAAKQDALARRAHYDELATKRKLRQSGN